MKKLFLSMMLVFAGISMFSQCNYNETETINVSNQLTLSTLAGGHMERDGRHLTLDGRQLLDSEVKQLVGSQNYETYLGAQKQITTGNVFMGVFIGTAAAAAAMMVTGAATDNMDLVYLGYIPAIAADVSLPLWIVFSSIGKGRMNWVANEYNNSKSVSFNLSPSVMRCNTMPDQANLGVGMTFSVNF
ncbi:MAG: hypothetical protein II829_02315 [Bacteroidales bacterium]|nr:hypothetical protein [Bacteroidales bacterium]